MVKVGAKPDFIQALPAAYGDVVQALKDRTDSKTELRTATSALRNTALSLRAQHPWGAQWREPVPATRYQTQPRSRESPGMTPGRLSRQGRVDTS